MVEDKVVITSRLGSILVNLETLYVLDFADKQYKLNDPIKDEYFREIGSVQLLRRVLGGESHRQTMPGRLKRLKQLNFIKASGIEYVKRQRNVPHTTGKGRSSAAMGNLVYELTKTGKQFLEGNLYLLERFDITVELDRSLKSFTSNQDNNK